MIDFYYNLLINFKYYFLRCRWAFVVARTESDCLLSQCQELECFFFSPFFFFLLGSCLQSKLDCSTSFSSFWQSSCLLLITAPPPKCHLSMLRFPLRWHWCWCWCWSWLWRLFYCKTAIAERQKASKATKHSTSGQNSLATSTTNKYK